MRLIDAIKYSDTLIWMHHNGDYQSPQDAIKAALFNLAQSPTITLDDLRPKGRWIVQDETFTRFRCSHCECKNFGQRWNFCPACGAEMEVTPNE